MNKQIRENMNIKGTDGEGLEDEELDIGNWKKGILVIQCQEALGNHVPQLCGKQD